MKLNPPRPPSLLLARVCVCVCAILQDSGRWRSFVCWNCSPKIKHCSGKNNQLTSHSCTHTSSRTEIDRWSDDRRHRWCIQCWLSLVVQVWSSRCRRGPSMDRPNEPVARRMEDTLAEQHRPHLRLAPKNAARVADSIATPVHQIVERGSFITHHTEPARKKVIGQQKRSKRNLPWNAFFINYSDLPWERISNTFVWYNLATKPDGKTLYFNQSVE